MQLFAILGHLFSTAVIGFVGVRLLLRAGPKGAPERWLGWSMLAGCVGYVGIMCTVAVPALQGMPASWLAYGAGVAQDAIWFGRPWSAVWKHLADTLLYALITGALFAWLW